ncbi:MAG: methyltransferase domain-containing protein [Clostridia bacterium]|nr:methyltransferase domain-containing protein [Clostridia bacterium]
MNPDILICPLCGGRLEAAGGALHCASGHAFDIASSGYCNLMRPGKLRNRRSGDDAQMVSARRRFLSAGYYRPLRDAVTGVLRKYAKGGAVLDAGCGEGYYTNAFAADEAFTGVLGVDASKYAVDKAAKEARRLGLSEATTYITANFTDMPVKGGSAAAVTSIFAPCAYGEFSRVLAEGGAAVVVSAGERHLYELKALLYGSENVRENKKIDHGGAAAHFGFEVIGNSRLEYRETVEGEETIAALYMMTPYSKRTSRSDADRLLGCVSLNLNFDFDITVLRKERANKAT